MNTNKPRRCILHAQDIKTITGVSDRTCYKNMAKMRIYFGKFRHQYLTLAEYSEFSGIPLEQIYYLLGMR